MRFGRQLRAKKKEGKEKKRAPSPLLPHILQVDTLRPKETVLRRKQTKGRLSHLITNDKCLNNWSTSCFNLLSPKLRRSRQNGFQRFPHVFFSPIGILESSHNHPPITLTAPCLLYTLKKPHNVKKVRSFDHYFANWACLCLEGAQVRHRRSFLKKKPLGD